MLINHLMKFRMLLCASLLVIFTVSLSGCKDDDEATPKLELRVDGETFSLEDAQIFLRLQGEHEGPQTLLTKTYVITDGEIVSGNGYYMEDYEDATYFIFLQLGIPEGNEWAAGEFVQYRNWGEVPAGGNASFITSGFLQSNQHILTTPPDMENDAVIISGGFNPDEKITIRLNGKLQYYRMDENEEWVISNEESKLNFSGTVINKPLQF